MRSNVDQDIPLVEQNFIYKDDRYADRSFEDTFQGDWRGFPDALIQKAKQHRAEGLDWLEHAFKYRPRPVIISADPEQVEPILLACMILLRPKLGSCLWLDFGSDVGEQAYADNKAVPGSWNSLDDGDPPVTYTRLVRATPFIVVNNLPRPDSVAVPALERDLRYRWAHQYASLIFLIGEEATIEHPVIAPQRKAATHRWSDTVFHPNPHTPPTLHPRL